MTLEEKLRADPAAAGLQGHRRRGPQGLGSILSVTDPAQIAQLQHIAVDESRLKIPLLFAFDTIHGFRTVFPIPLGTGASFDPAGGGGRRQYRRPRVGGRRLKQTYAPMVDVSHEPRWGRISEAAGEDPYLNSVIAAARVKGTQGSDYSAPDKLIASAEALRRLRPARGRARLQHDRHVRAAAAELLPAAVQGRVDAGADTFDVLVQRDQRRARLRQQLHDERHPQGRVGLRRLRRERLDRGRRAARLPAGEPRTTASAATASPPTARTRPRRR